MLSKPLFLLITLTTTILCNAQYYSAESHGKAGAAVADKHISSVFNNTAGVAYIEKISMSVQYSLPFVLTELSAKKIGAAFPIKYGVISGVVQQSGFNLLSENTFSIAFARKIGENISGSFQVNYLNVNQSYVKNKGQLFSSVGINYTPFKSIDMGLLLVNPENSSLTIDGSQYRMPSLFIYGFKWNVNSEFRLSSEIEKERERSSVLKIGAEYELFNSVFIRTGYFGKPIQYCIGLGFLIKGIAIDAAVSHHPVLGMSSSIGLNYQFKK